MSRLRPWCVPCDQEMRCERNEVDVRAFGALWSGDRYECEGCGHQIVTGFGAPREDPAEDGFRVIVEGVDYTALKEAK